MLTTRAAAASTMAIMLTPRSIISMFLLGSVGLKADVMDE
jgi:hypothetical protein